MIHIALMMNLIMDSVSRQSVFSKVAENCTLNVASMNVSTCFDDASKIYLPSGCDREESV